MKLDAPFYKLPVRLDMPRLLEEIRQFAPYEWKLDRLTYIGAGGYSYINLVSHRGRANDIWDAPMRPTRYLERCPYLKQVLASFETPLAEVRIRRLLGSHSIPLHYDEGEPLYHRLRTHIPIVTDPEVLFYCDDQPLHMRAGEVWLFDRLRLHKVINAGSAERIHLVFDTIPSPAFRALVDRAYQPFTAGSIETEPQLVTYRPDENAVLETVLTPPPPVVHPGDLGVFLTDLVTRWKSPDATKAAQLLDAVNDLREEWRACYAVVGTDRSGWSRFREIATRAMARVRAIDGVRPDGTTNPLFADRLEDFLAYGALKPPRAAPPFASTTELEFTDEMLFCAAPGDGLRFDCDAVQSRPISADAVAFLSAMFPFGSPQSAVDSTGIELDAAMQKLLDELVELGVLSLPAVEPMLDFADRTERRAREDAAGRARLAAPAPKPPPPSAAAVDGFRLRETVWFRLMPLAIFAWVPTRGDYVAINVGIVGVLELATRGTSMAAAADILGFEPDKLARAVASLIDLELLA
jgi:hypothetical protein